MPDIALLNKLYVYDDRVFLLRYGIRQHYIVKSAGGRTVERQTMLNNVNQGPGDDNRAALRNALRRFVDGLR